MGKIVKDLSGSLRGTIYDDRLTRSIYSTDASMFKVRPKAICEAQNIQDIQRVLEYATPKGISISCRGGGTGLAGESLGEGIIIDFFVTF